MGSHVMVEGSGRVASYLVFATGDELREKLAVSFQTQHCAVLPQSPGSAMEDLPFFVTVYAVDEEDKRTFLFHGILPVLRSQDAFEKVSSIFNSLRAKKLV